MPLVECLGDLTSLSNVDGVVPETEVYNELQPLDSIDPR